MNRSMKHMIATSALAALVLGAAASAKAGDVHVSVGVTLPHATPVPMQPVHMPVHEVYDDAPRGYRQARDWDAGCRAPRWDPHVRYMPGQLVRRHGNLFVARRVSARVWNVNSPPEWTPQYWAWAECR